MKFTRKSMRRTAAACLSGALMLSMAAMPAFAQEGGYEPSAGDSFTITKYLTKEATTMTPNVSFTFTVTPETETDNLGERGNIPVSAGVAEGVTVDRDNASADFAPDGTLDRNTVLSDTVGFKINTEVFTEFGPGIYKYTIQEDAVDHDGITKDDNVLDLYVYIQNGEAGLEAAYTELVDPDGGSEGGEVKTDSFTNDYDKDGQQLHDLTLYKVLSGNAADMRDEFTFTIQIDGEEGEQYYAEVGTYTTDGEFAKGDAVIYLTAGEKTNVTLGHNDAVKIYGLDSDDAYTIEEISANTDGYKVEIDGTADDDGVTNGTISIDSVVCYENIKEASTPTGIAMTVAPYVLLVALAGGACFIFLRRRHAE